MLRSMLLAALVIAGAEAGAAAGSPEAPDAPHLLNCTVKDTLTLDSNGSLVKLPPLPPGARAIGRVTSFVVDPISGVVRLPGLGDIAWIVVKGRDPGSAEIILTPATGLQSATTISIHLRRSGDDFRFVFFEVERIMSGTCALLP